MVPPQSVLRHDVKTTARFKIGSAQIRASETLRESLQPPKPGDKGIRYTDLVEMSKTWTQYGFTGWYASLANEQFQRLVTEDVAKDSVLTSFDSGRVNPPPPSGQWSSKNAHRRELDWPSVASINRYVTFFDDVFFFGSLENKVSIRIYKIMLEGAADMESATGHTGKDAKAEDRRAIISLYDHHKDGFWVRLSKVLGTLLHEMTHVYLEHVHNCECEECHDREPSVIGITGHGPAFTQVFQAIKESEQMQDWNKFLHTNRSRFVLDASHSRKREEEQFGMHCTANAMVIRDLLNLLSLGPSGDYEASHPKPQFSSYLKAQQLHRKAAERTDQEDQEDQRPAK